MDGDYTVTRNTMANNIVDTLSLFEENKIIGKSDTLHRSLIIIWLK